MPTKRKSLKTSRRDSLSGHGGFSLAFLSGISLVRSCLTGRVTGTRITNRKNRRRPCREWSATRLLNWPPYHPNGVKVAQGSYPWVNAVDTGESQNTGAEQNQRGSTGKCEAGFLVRSDKLSTNFIPLKQDEVCSRLTLNRNDKLSSENLELKSQDRSRKNFKL